MYSYNLTVPPWENYLLYLASFVDPPRDRGRAPSAAQVVERLVRIYGEEGNERRTVAIKGYIGWKRYYIEPLSYLAIWTITVLMILPFVVARKKRELPYERCVGRTI